MSDEERRYVTMETPCIKVCAIDPATQLCTGCHRSMDEIAHWSRMNGAERHAVMARLAARGLLAREPREVPTKPAEVPPVDAGR